MDPQDAYTCRVEGGDPHGFSHGPDQGLHPVFHLTSSLVGEGDGQNIHGMHTMISN